MLWAKWFQMYPAFVLKFLLEKKQIIKTRIISKKYDMIKKNRKFKFRYEETSVISKNVKYRYIMPLNITKMGG